jgi:type IV pilus assembly protein PilB
MPAPKKLGEKLVDVKLITVDKLNQAIERHKETGVQLSDILVDMGFVKEEQLRACLRDKFGVSSANLDSVSFIEPGLLSIIPRDVAEKYLVIPMELKNRRWLTVAMVDPLDIADIEDIKFRTGYSITPTFAFEAGIRQAIERFYGGTDKSSVEAGKGMGRPMPVVGEKGAISVAQPERAYGEEVYPEETLFPDEGVEVVYLTDLDSPLNKFLQGVLNIALQNYADEIHIEAHSDGVRIRYRIDNFLYEALKLPGSIKNALLSRLKRLLGLETTVKTGSQKKYVALKPGDRSPTMDIAALYYPLSNGEKILLKLKNKSSNLTLDNLGLDASTVKNLRETLRKPTGCILVVGPVWSGKTTILYMLLNQGLSPDLNRVALEDATTYPLKGIHQIRVYPEENFTYLTGLQFIKNHKPDAIAIDNLTDLVIADKVFDLATETRLVSILGAVDTTQAVMKLLSYVPGIKLANSLNCIIGQRLVRKICETCKKRVVLSTAHREQLGFSDQDAAYTGKGCLRCGYTGYLGVTGIFEVLWCSDAIRRLIIKGCTAEELKTMAINEGMATLRKNGLEKVKQGITTVNEVIRSTLRSTV